MSNISHENMDIITHCPQKAIKKDNIKLPDENNLNKHLAPLKEMFSKPNNPHFLNNSN